MKILLQTKFWRTRYVNVSMEHFEAAIIKLAAMENAADYEFKEFINKGLASCWPFCYRKKIVFFDILSLIY